MKAKKQEIDITPNQNTVNVLSNASEITMGSDGKIYATSETLWKKNEVPVIQRQTIEIPVCFRYSLAFDRKNETIGDNPKSDGLIQLRVYDCINKRSLFYSTGIRIPRSDWDYRARLVNMNNPLYAELNYVLQNTKIKINSLELDYIKRNVRYNLSTLKVDIKSHRQPSFNITFNEFCDMIIDETREERSKSSNKNLHGTLTKLNKFAGKLEFNSIDVYLIKKFQKWLVESEKQQPNTVVKHLSLIRFFINKAIQKGYMTEEQNPFRSGEIKLTKVWTTEHKNLTEDEMKLAEDLLERFVSEFREECVGIVSKKEEKENEEVKISKTKCQVLAMFLLSCYTGLRFSDIITLREQNIVEKNGTVWIVKKQVKTKGMVEIPIGKLFGGKAVRLIELYGGIENLVGGVRNQLANSYLKKIMKEIGIEKGITFHSGRHTFSSILAAQNLSPQYIAKLTGHSNIATLKSYVTIEGSDVLKQLEKNGMC